MHQKIEETIRKLLRLAQSVNIFESANAAKRAQFLMEKHRIEVTLEDDIEEVYDFDEPLETFKRAVQWKGNLAEVICDTNGCHGHWEVVGDEVRLVIAGPKRDCDAVRYLYRYLVREISRLCREKAKEHGAAPRRNVAGRVLNIRVRMGTKWRNSFRYGAISIISIRLREAQEQAWNETEADNSRALAVIEKRMAQVADVTRWVNEQLEIEGPRGDPPDLNLEGFNAGMRAAQDISLVARAKLSDGRDTAVSDG